MKEAGRAVDCSSDAVGASDPDFYSDPRSAGDPPTASDAPGGRARGGGPFGHDRYERRQLVGVGGMGRVTVVYDRALGREVALKEPGAGFDATLLEEARRTAALDHPGIVPVLDAGVDASGRPWYTMRLLRGRPLEEALRAAPDLAGRLTFLRALLTASEAVAHAHARGVVHRDLTPANLLLGELGETCVADWGLAAPRGARGGGGTPGYRAPEQEAGAPADVRADVYALGAILFRMCAGGPLGTGASLPTEMPPELATILARATAPRAEDRYADARAFAEDLAAFLDGRRVSAHVYSPWELLRRFAAAHRAPLGVAVAALFTLAGTGTAQYLATVRERDRALAAERTASMHLGVALAAQAVDAFREGQLGDAAVLAAHAYARGAADDPAARHARAHALGVLAGIDAGATPEPRPSLLPPPDCVELRLHAEGYVCLGEDRASAWAWNGAPRGAWSGRWTDAAASAHGLVWLGGDGAIRVGAALRPLPDDLHPAQLAVGSHLLASARGRVLATLSLSDGAVHTEPVPCAEGVRVLAAVPDEAGRLVVACSSQEVYVGAPGALVRTAAVLPHATVLAWTEGDLLVGTVSGEVVRLTVDGREVWREPVGDAAVLDVGTAGGRIVWARTPRGTTLLDQRTGALRTVLPALRTAPALDATGVLHGVTSTREIRAWRLPDRWSGARLSTPSGLSALAVSPDGAEITLGGRATSVARWGVADGAVQWVPLLDGVVKSFAWRGDGLRATVSGGNATFLLASGGPVRDPLRPTAYRRLGTLPDGSLVAIPYFGGPQVWDAADAPVVGLPEIGESIDLGVGPDGAAILDLQGGVWWMGSAPVRVSRRATLPGARAVDAGPGGRVVVATADRIVVLGASGAAELEVPLDGRDAVDVAWSADGRLILTGNLDGTADLRRAEDGAVLATLAGHADRVAAVEFAPDGSWLVTASWDHSARRWSLAPVYAPPTPAEVEARWGTSLDATLTRQGRTAADAPQGGGDAAAAP